MSGVGLGAHEDAERVRSCLGCGELVPFELRTCPACGHHEPLASAAAGQARACPACEHEVPDERLFCGACGRDVGLPPASAAGADAPAAGRPAVAWLLALGLLAPLAQLAALHAVVRGGG